MDWVCRYFMRLGIVLIILSASRIVGGGVDLFFAMKVIPR